MTKKTFNIAVRYELQNGDVVLFDKNGKILPAKGTHLEGDFIVIGDNTATLRGLPESVGGDFNLAGEPASV